MTRRPGSGNTKEDKRWWQRQDILAETTMRRADKDDKEDKCRRQRYEGRALTVTTRRPGDDDNKKGWQQQRQEGLMATMRRTKASPFWSRGGTRAQTRGKEANRESVKEANTSDK